MKESILVSHKNPYILVKTATVYWNYKNVFTGYNVWVNRYQGRVTFTEAYWTFQMLVDNITLEANRVYVR